MCRGDGGVCGGGGDERNPARVCTDLALETPGENAHLQLSAGRKDGADIRGFACSRGRGDDGIVRDDRRGREIHANIIFGVKLYSIFPLEYSVTSDSGRCCGCQIDGIARIEDAEDNLE